MKVEIRSIELHVQECRTRLPFRFGMVTMTRAPLCFATVRIHSEASGEHLGHAADLMVPKWFEKDPRKTIEDDFRRLAASAREAAESYSSSTARTVFGLWRDAYRERVACRPDGASDSLVRGFGVALIERALMDATCRAARLSFFDAWREDLFEFDAGALHATAAGWSVSESLGRRPLDTCVLRHTVGLADALVPEEVPEEWRLDDDHPLSLVEDIERYGLHCFKIKLEGDRRKDVARLVRLGDLIGSTVGDRFSYTLDGNEQFDSIADLLATLEEAEREAPGLLDGLLHVEQPLSRADSFDAGRLAGIEKLGDIAPVILDEADSSLDSFPRGLELGYRGISVKNCKGVFRALANRALCDLTSRDSRKVFQSSEDLTNLALLPLQQDLATLSTLGLRHAERNGHHYFRGLDHLPAAEIEAALAQHADLYEHGSDGPRLLVRDGRLRFASIHGPGYGTRVPFETEGRTPLDEWAGWTA